jgi:TonB family protein
LAVLDFAGGDEQRSLETGLRAALAGDARAAVLDPAQVTAAVAGNYTGSLNLSLEEARRLGAAIGCDSFVLGQTFAERNAAEPPVFTLFIATFLVDARTGRLVRFDSLTERAPTAAAVRAQGLARLQAQAVTLIDQALGFRREWLARTPAAEAEVEELPGDGAPTAGLTPPQFFRRYTPRYPELAAYAGVTATVELSVVFGADGRIGDALVTRWAGFGLDEAALETVRGVKFEPARRQGRPVSVRAPVRYNFRRPRQ